MTDINLKTLTPDTSLPTTGFLFGADSQAVSTPSVYSTQTVATTLLGSTSLTGDTLTADAPVLNLAQTWNNGAVTFTGVRFNAAGSSSTNSAAASLLMDLQVGAVSKLAVAKDGSLSIFNAGNTSIRLANTTYGLIALNNSGVQLSSDVANNFIAACASMNFSSGGPLSWSSDTYITRKTTRNLQLGQADAATALAQTLSVQSVVAGTSNTAGQNFTITGSQGTGTGVGGAIIFQVAPSGSSGSAQNALVEGFQINQNKYCYLNQGIIYATGNSAGVLLGRNPIDGTSGVILGNGVSFRWAAAAPDGSATDLALFRDAANTFAQRNGGNAQTLNIYNTYTSSTSFERYSVDWITTANLAIVGPNKGSGGGTQRVQRLSYLEDGGAGSTVPLLGSTCPAASGTVKSWIKIITSDGTTAYIPCWA
jgi:hypothetical protein